MTLRSGVVKGDSGGGTCTVVEMESSTQQTLRNRESGLAYDSVFLSLSS